MGRAWRIEYEGALYHLMSRGNDGQHIYLNDADRNLFLELGTWCQSLNCELKLGVKA